MKLNHYIYSLIAGLVLMLSACSPDEYDMGKKTYVSDDLAEGIAYTVTIAGNQVRLKSNITGCTPLWVTPQGRSQESELAIELPFAGSYEVRRDARWCRVWRTLYFQFSTKRFLVVGR